MRFKNITLDGWHRLWLVVTVLWALPVLAVGYFEWPSPAKISHGEVYALMLKTSADGARFSDFLDGLAQHGVVPPVGTYLSLDPNYGTPNAKPAGGAVEIGGHHLRLAFDGMDEADVNRAAREYYDALRHVLAVRRATFAGETVSAWVIPLAALYALGWAVGWVRRGFVKRI